MAEGFKNIEMIGLEKSECTPMDTKKIKFTEITDKFTFVIKLSQEAPEIWIDFF